jgi:pimeloyl-ACP methyl ester carboxylesterase
LPSFERFVDLPQGPARVRVRGEGPPLLWSHGVFFPIDVDDRSTLGRVLGDAPGFTVIRWDARGHGRTPPAATAREHRWDELGREVLALADALGIERFAAGGISMGAAVTLHAAMSAPERVAAMLLLALPTAWETRPAERVRYRELLAFATSEALAAHVQGDLDALFPAGSLPGELRAMVAYLRSAEWPALERIIGGAAESDLPDRRDLARLPTRALLRPWPNDAGHPLSTAEALAAALPAADLTLLGGFDDEAGIRGALAELLGECEGLPAAPIR